MGEGKGGAVNMGPGECLNWFHEQPGEWALS